MSAPRTRRLVIRSALVALAVGLVTSIGLLIVPAPAFVVRRLATSNADWLLSNYLEAAHGPFGYVKNGYRKILATYIQYGLANELRVHLQIGPTTGSDVERLSVALVKLRSVMLNQAEVPHPPMQWSTLLSGVGYCDQMNAMAANTLGGAFAHAQIVGLTDPATHAEHTIGRVWSSERNDWLYFDLWGAVSVFRLDSSGKPLVLFSRDPFPESSPASVTASIPHMYEFASHGVPFNEYPRTFGRFVVERTARMVRQTQADAFQPIAAAQVTNRATPKVAARPVQSSEEIRRLFAAARLSQLSGDRQDAASRFARIAARDTVTVLGRAAATFAERLAAAPR